MASAEFILRSIASLLTALENGLACLLVLGSKNLRGSPTNGFIASLALSDFLNGALLIPLFLAKPTSEAIGYIVAFILLAGVGSVCAITYDRYTAVANPFLYRFLTNKNFARITLSIWIGSLGVALLPLSWNNNRTLTVHKIYMYCLCAAVFLPYCVIFAAYLVTFNNLKRHVHCLRDIRARSHASRQVTSERNVVRLMCAVAVLFILCWLPTLYATMVDTIGRLDLIPKVLDSIALFGIQVHSLINPLLYALKKQDFHDELKRLFYKCKRSSDSRRVSPVNLATLRNTVNNTGNNSPSLLQSIRRPNDEAENNTGNSSPSLVQSIRRHDDEAENNTGNSSPSLVQSIRRHDDEAVNNTGNSSPSLVQSVRRHNADEAETLPRPTGVINLGFWL